MLVNVHNSLIISDSKFAKNIEELREQQTEVFEPLRTLPRRSLREKRMPHRYQDYQMNSMVSEPYDTKLKIFNAVRSWHPVY